MSVGIFWVVFVIAILFMVALLLSTQTSNQIGNAAAAVVMFTFSIFCAVIGYGYGNVPSNVEKIGLRLTNGVVYQLVYSEKQGDGYVLVVKKFGTDDTLAIRTDTVPPGIFTLVSGQPVEVKK